MAKSRAARHSDESNREVQGSLGALSRAVAPHSKPKIGRTSEAMGGVTADERALIARFLRIIREPAYWLSGYVEWLLAMDAESPNGVRVAEAQQMLKDIAGLASWADWFETDSNSKAAVLRYFGHRFFPDRVDNLQSEICTTPEALEFAELVRMWRNDHPGPPKPQVAPSGHLGRANAEDEED